MFLKILSSLTVQRLCSSLRSDGCCKLTKNLWNMMHDLSFIMLFILKLKRLFMLIGFSCS